MDQPSRGCYKSVLTISPRRARPVVAVAIAAAFVATALPSPAALAAGACGKDRWSVKTGTDTGAALVDLQAPRPTSVGVLVAEEQPDHWSPSLPRQGQVETTVWVVTAFLQQYAEADDLDYHLVLGDDAGRTMIAEIPSPTCVGRASPFAAGIVRARADFEADREGFHTVDGGSGFRELKPPVLVQVTGVGFFDRHHNQRGLADNAIELHPVLDVQVNPAPSAARSELIADGGFEQDAGTGGSAWSGGTNLATHPLFVSDPARAHTGGRFARLGERNLANDAVSQSVSIPAGADKPTLSFWANVVTHEHPGAAAVDTLSVEVDSSEGAMLAPLVASLSDVGAGADGAYVQEGPFDLSAFAGRSVQLTFRARTNDSLTTAFRIDDVSLTVAGAPKDLPPATTVTAPADGETVEGTVAVSAQAADAAGVATTRISVDGVERASGPGPAASFDWDTTKETNGPHAIVATASDGSGKAWTSSPVTVTVSNPQPVQLVDDPGFEQGAEAWSATPQVVTGSSGRPPHAGSRYAWMCGHGAVHDDRLFQAVAIPGSATTVRLSYFLHIDTEETGAVGVDRLRVEIRGPSGVLLSRRITYTNLGAADGFTEKTDDLSAFAGQTVRLWFACSEDASNQTSFVLDDVTLAAR